MLRNVLNQKLLRMNKNQTIIFENDPAELKSSAKLCSDGIIDLKRTGISPISPSIMLTPKNKFYII